MRSTKVDKDKRLRRMAEYAVSKHGKCLAQKYTNNRTHYLWECSCGCQWESSYHNVVDNETWCPKCSGNLPKDINWLQELAQKRNGRCLSTEYINTITKYEWECHLGHVWFAQANSVQQGHWCGACLGMGKKDINWLQELAQKRNGRCLSTEYVNSGARYVWQCERAHVWEARATDVAHHSSWCPSCFGTQPSAAQKELFAFVKEMDSSAVICNRTVIPPLEIDIWVPSQKIAIEYCGLFWHGEKHNGASVRKRHHDKYRRCLEAGVRLITVFESEWVHKTHIVKATVSNALKRSNNSKISARNCSIGIVRKTELRTFLNQNHILGYSSGSAIGLFFDNKLCACLVTRKRGDQTEIVRYATEGGYSVRGGFGKLLGTLSGNIVTFSDNRWSSGSMYHTLGFKKTLDVVPSYWYFKDGHKTLMHKSLFRKGKLIRQHGLSKELKEWDMALMLGYDRIWDCGLTRWELTSSAP